MQEAVGVLAVKSPGLSPDFLSVHGPLHWKKKTVLSSTTISRPQCSNPYTPRPNFAFDVVRRVHDSGRELFELFRYRFETPPLIVARDSCASQIENYIVIPFS